MSAWRDRLLEVVDVEISTKEHRQGEGLQYPKLSEMNIPAIVRLLTAKQLLEN